MIADNGENTFLELCIVLAFIIALLSSSYAITVIVLLCIAILCISGLLKEDLGLKYKPGTGTVLVIKGDEEVLKSKIQEISPKYFRILQYKYDKLGPWLAGTGYGIIRKETTIEYW